MTEATLSTPKNEQELFDAMNKAVSEGDSKEVDRLMVYELPSTDTSPDANQNQDPPAQPAPPAGENGEAPAAGTNDGSPPAQDPPAAAPPAADPPPQPAATPPALTPEQVQALVQRVHRLESDAGRVGNLQSQIADLKKQLKKVKAPAPAAAQPSAEQLRFEQRIKALKEIDPEQAELLELQQRQIVALREAAEKRDVPDDTSTDDDTDADEVKFQAELKRNVEIVEQVHPDAIAIFQHPAWQTWKAGLTPEQLSWATSSQPGHVISALTAFKNDFANKQRAAQQQQPPAQQPPAAATPPAADPPPAGNEAADAVRQQRERQLQATGDPRNTPIKAGGAVVDKDAMFSEMYNDILKKNHLG